MSKYGNHIIVVGGGVAGLLGALWAQATGNRVTLIERAKTCGGLLRSLHTPDGHFFDFGTHIPTHTKNPHVDALMFGDQLPVAWREIPRLKKGNYFHGHLNTTSQFIDITRLSKDIYHRALFELIGELTTNTGATNLQQSLEMHFGKTLATEVFTPLLKRIYRTPFEELDPGSHRFLAYARVIAASPEVSAELKHSPIYDAKFAFNDADSQAGATGHFYPKQGGTGAWVDAMVNRFVETGGRLLTDTGIEGIDVQRNTVKLADSETLSFDKLIWTAPLGMLARLLFPDMALIKPDFVPTELHHFVVSTQPLCDSHYVYINDSNSRSFRVTLYRNITGIEDDRRVTVEAVALDPAVKHAHVSVLDEVIAAGILGPGTEAVHASMEFLPNGFPETTLRLNAQNEEIRMMLDDYPDIMIGGRGASEAFFMNDVLLSMGKILEERFGLPQVQETLN